jgi:predicted XRE-type DNA-binding protein
VACLWGQAFSLPPGFCPASRHKREERRLKAGGRLKAWPHLGAACLASTYAMNKSESYASVWDAIADTPGQAANLRARAELMQQIAAFVKRQDWTQVEAASHCGVTQPRINDLLRGRVSRFSLDALVNISTAMGCRVRVDIEAA